MRLSGIIFAIWMISIPVLGVSALVLWFKRLRSGLSTWRSIVGTASVAVVLTSWVLFVWMAHAGQIGGFGSHYMTARVVDRYLLISLGTLATSFALASWSRATAVTASLLMFALWGASELVA